jgi:dTDP-4-dehydrorhamnose 3,5-epimerase
MEVTATALPDVLVLTPRVHGDDRGFFLESWNERTFRTLGLDLHFVQDNQSRSAKWVLRGLHYQLNQPQGKLVRCIKGAIYDVAVDLRRSSPSFGRWVGFELTEQNHKMLWIPPGFGHGFLSLSDGAEVLYKVTDFYDKTSDRSVAWADPTIGIDWPLPAGTTPSLSAKDARAPTLSTAEVFG